MKPDNPSPGPATSFGLKIRPVGERFLASSPEIGAVGVFDEIEIFALEYLRLNNGDVRCLAEFFEKFGYPSPRASRSARRLHDKLKKGGWFRKSLEGYQGRRLQSVYLTITRRCNQACPYCCQGGNGRGASPMPLDRVETCLKRIKELNPRCLVLLTGGEPFLHPEWPEVLDRVQAEGFEFGILTNGTLIEEETVERLAGYGSLRFVQVSLDGISAAVHALTRGDSFEAAIRGVNLLIDRRLPFVLSPTLHKGNLHEIYGIIRFALSRGGNFSLNRIVPVPGIADIAPGLECADMMAALVDIRRRVHKDFPDLHGRACPAVPAGPRYDAGPVEDRITVTCAAGSGTLDIDSSGEIYPCPVLRGDEFRLGNLEEDGFEDIFRRAERLGIRTPSYRIPKCRTCDFVAVCGGGCRAQAYYAFGSFDREDNFCELLYQRHLADLTGPWDSRDPDGPASRIFKK